MVNKLNLKSCLGISIFLLAVTGVAQAATITVGQGRSGGYDFIDIQAGIDAAVDGDTVLVVPGEYVITEPITFRGKAITVRSETGPDEAIIRMGTPADPDRASVVVFENNETSASVLEGFTIIRGMGCRLWAAKIGQAPKFWCTGGGILFNASSGALKNCAIIQNRAEAGGGVIVSSGSSASLTNCIINENSATDPDGAGGGICCFDDSSVTMTECVAMNNSTVGAGGGVTSYVNSSVTMTNCIIMSNTAGRLGGGIYAGWASVTLSNCTIARNTAAWGGGGVASAYEALVEISNCTISSNSGAVDAGGGGALSFNGSTTIKNSIIWGNTSAKGPEISLMEGGKQSIAYSNVAGGQSRANVEGNSTLDWGPDNINTDPCFTDLANNDYHLKSQVGRWDANNQSWIQDDVTSLCIDAGDPDSDWRAEIWPHGIRVNMGAYGGTLQASRSLSDSGNIADVNRDAIVDSADMCMMVDHWHLYEPYCDIAPVPFGDGIVDVQDLVILAENLFEDYRMIAHWKLDEAEGDIAYDSVANCDGTLRGGPVWQPGDGMVDGALQFDGVNDYVSTEFVLNPSDGTFSVFAWIKGGAPGQLIISQLDGNGTGETWLCTDTSNANLMTALVPQKIGRNYPQPLISGSIISDGQWHHIGFVWDGSYRILYADGIEVAKDTTAQNPLKSATDGLYIGAGKNLDAGTFFSGLIDDVRIYKQALSAEDIVILAQ